MRVLRTVGAKNENNRIFAVKLTNRAGVYVGPGKTAVKLLVQPKVKKDHWSDYMNTLQNLIDNGIEINTAIRMLSDYQKRINTSNGIYEGMSRTPVTLVMG